MYRLSVGVALGLLLSSSAAMATCPTLQRFANGDTADATKVMGNFDSINNCLNAATVTFTGILGVQSGNVTQMVLNNTLGSTNPGNDIVFQQGGVSNWVIGQQAGDSTGNFNIYSFGHGLTMSINYTSGVVSCPVSCSSGSDRRIKRNIQKLPSENGLAAVRQLVPVSFNWAKGDASAPQIGFIAQEVKKVFPQLVTNSGVKTQSTPDGMLTMNYGSLTAPIVLALQQLDARTTALESATHKSYAKSVDSAKSDEVRDLISKLKAANDSQAAQIERLEAKLTILEQKVRTQTAQR